MRRKVTVETLKQFMQELAAAARSPGKAYFTGGATALLLGFREQTIDIDLKLDPEPEGAFEAIAALKNRLNLNVELASPDDFIPELPGWQERSRFIQQQGKLFFYHYDFYAQALAKIERGHETDQKDVDHLIASGIVETKRLLELFSLIEGRIYLYPELDRNKFRRAVERVVKEAN